MCVLGWGRGGGCVGVGVCVCVGEPIEVSKKKANHLDATDVKQKQLYTCRIHFAE